MSIAMLNVFIAKTIRPFLIIFGLATCMTLPFAIDIDLITPMFGGLLDYTPSSACLASLGNHDLRSGGTDGGRRVPSLVTVRDHAVQPCGKSFHGLAGSRQPRSALGKWVLRRPPARFHHRCLQHLVFATRDGLATGSRVGLLNVAINRASQNSRAGVSKYDPIGV